MYCGKFGNKASYSCSTAFHATVTFPWRNKTYTEGVIKIFQRRVTLSHTQGTYQIGISTSMPWFTTSVTIYHWKRLVAYWFFGFACFRHLNSRDIKQLSHKGRSRSRRVTPRPPPFAAVVWLVTQALARRKCCVTSGLIEGTCFAIDG